MKYLTATFLFLSISSPLFGQNDIEYYKSVIDTTQNNELKLSSLDSLVSLTKKGPAEPFVGYSKQYIALAESMGKYAEAINKGNRVFYTLNILQNKNEEAMQLIQRLQQYEGQVKDSFLIGNLYLKKGGAYYERDFAKAIENYTLAIEKFGKKDSIYVADAYLFRGNAHDYMGSFLNAINDYEIAARYYEDLNDLDYVFRTKLSTSIVYSRNGFYDKAQEIREDIIAYGIEKGDHPIVVTTLINMASSLGKQNLIDKKKEVLLRALKINTENSNKEIMRDLSINCALIKIYADEKDIENAKIHFNNVENRKEELGANNFLLREYYLAKSYFSKMNDDNNAALKWMLKVDDINKKIKDAEGQIRTKKRLSEVYESMGDNKNSLKNYKQYTHLKDSVFNIAKTNSLLYYQTLYETEKKERELVEKNTSIKLLEKDNETKQRVLLLSVTGLSLLFLIIYLYRNRIHLSNAKEQQEEFTRQLLTSQEEERKRISKDLHDGLGQSLLLIKNKVVLTEDDSAKSMVNDAIEEVRSISRALHPFQLEELGLTKAIENVVSQLDESTDIFISSELDDVQNLFSSIQEVNIFRIIQESLSNIVKHASAKGARIEIKKQPKRIQLIIKDNGKGFDFSERFNDFKSLGLKTLKERTLLLGGSMRVDSEKNKGTTLVFIIPYKA